MIMADLTCEQLCRAIHSAKPPERVPSNWCSRDRCIWRKDFGYKGYCPFKTCMERHKKPRQKARKWRYKGI